LTAQVELPAVHAKGYTDNVVDLMVGKMSVLGPSYDNRNRPRAGLPRAPGRFRHKGLQEKSYVRIWEKLRNYSAPVGKGAAGPGTLGPAAGVPGWGGAQPDAPNCFECLLRLSDNASASYIKIFIHLVLTAKMKGGKMQSSAVKPSRHDPSAPSTKPIASATTEMRIRISLLRWRIGHRLKQLVGRFATHS
jgi:hypothetical protein